MKLSNADENQAQRLARVSPIAWRHVNFQGRYNFRLTSQTPDIDQLVEKLSWAKKPQYGIIIAYIDVHYLFFSFT
jgi:hypothetical protein